MKTSVAWLNRYLSPGNVTPDEAEQILMHVGFPIESREPLPDGDTMLDVEITSNRGDCLSHVGLAREIAAKTGRTLVMPKADLPAPGEGIGHAADLVALENTRPDLCPLFTIRVIRGVKVGGSPAWLRGALEAVGQRSISNVVDCTNFVNFELGNPSHVFDMAKLAGPKIIIRPARSQEKLTTLDGKQRVLADQELVVADAERAQGLAGVIGGHDAEVTHATTDVVLEVATWAPVAVRSSSRRHGVRTDSSYRYERTVDPRSLDAASRRLASLIIETAGGRLCEGVVSAGRSLPDSFAIRLRPARCSAILGAAVSVDEIVRILRGLEVDVQPIGRSGEELACTPPHWRPDLTREVDLIEEVARVRGLEQIHVTGKIAVAVKPPQNSERAQRELSMLLTGLGFFETVTFSFLRPAHAEMFLIAGSKTISVDDDRRGAEPTLRPSVVPSLLACRRKNQDGDVTSPGGVRLFEVAAVFAESAASGIKPATVGSLVPPPHGPVTQPRRVALLADVLGAGVAGKRTHEELQSGVRMMRGVIESIVHVLGGATPRVECHPCEPLHAGWRDGACARVTVNGRDVGVFGIVSDAAQREFGLECPVVAAEVDLAPLIDLFPPKAKVSALPEFPAVERDLTVIVPEETRWGQIESVVQTANLDRFETLSYVGTYRGKQVGDGRKSMTMRLRFRDATKTLRGEEVDPQINTLIERAKKDLGAEVRTA